MVQHIGLVVAQVADRVLPEVRVIERKHLQVGETIQVQHFFKTADLIATDVQVIQRHQVVEARLDGLNLIAGNPELFQVDETVKVLDILDFVIANPESFKAGQIVEPLNVFDAVVREVELFEGKTLVETVNFADFVLVEP